MESIVDYAKRAFTALDAESFTAVDSLILAWMCHFEFSEQVAGVASREGVRLHDLLRAEYFDAYVKGLWEPDKSIELFTALAASPRFRSIQLSSSVEQIDENDEKQFAALTFLINDDLLYVAFKGTDRTLVGWKEDFNMAYQCPVPAQESAARYLEKIGAHTSANIIVGGHSKGGNLAIYAAAMNGADLGDRLLRVFSHDGPGFLPEQSERPEFLAIAGKMEKTVPQSSVVGMLLDQSHDVRVIKSSRHGLWQHDPFSWMVKDNDFVTVDTLTVEARHIDSTLSTWLAAHSDTERERFVDTVYELITLPGIETIDDLAANWQKAFSAIRGEIATMDPETREFLSSMLRGLAATTVQQIPQTLKTILPSRSDEDHPA